jgi:hypothetical protein
VSTPDHQQTLDRQRRTLILVTVLVAIALAITAMFWYQSTTNKPVVSQPKVSPSPTLPTGTASIKPSAPHKVTKPKVNCANPPSTGFTPNRIAVTGVTRSSPVLSLPRDREGVPGTPPVDSTGKNQFAFDAPGVHPGNPAGNVLLNAHTWPDGSAMGNRLLSKLGTGGSMALFGSDGQTLCYQVIERMEVVADRVTDAQLDKIYSTTGTPQAVIIVCSGKRTAPGVWTHRTIWFAKPALKMNAA